MSRKIISLGRQVGAARTQINPAKKVIGNTETIKEISASEKVTTMPKQEVCWMRHPESGCWIPENSFHVPDAAVMREKLLNWKK